jgi:hypothetical protein
VGATIAEQIAEAKRRREEELFHPDLQFYERHLKRQVPQSLRNLYSDRNLLVSEFQYDDLHYICFEPLTENALILCRKWFRMEVVPIAGSNGDIIYLRPGSNETDAVFITYHDGGETEQLADDISTFIQQARKALEKTNTALERKTSPPRSK